MTTATTTTPAKRGRPVSLFPPNGKIASTYVPARILAVIDATARSRMVSRVDIVRELLISGMLSAKMLTKAEADLSS